MRGWLILKLEEFGVDRGVVGKVVDYKGRGRLGVNVRRGDARREIGLNAFPKAVMLEMVDTGLSSTNSILEVSLVFMNKLKVGIDSNICSSKSL